MRICLFLIAITALHCAKPCPVDINLGDLKLDPSSVAFIPTVQQVKTIKFRNGTGQKMEFTNASIGEGLKFFELPVETLCQRGDFVDKTAQTVFFKADQYNIYYQSDNLQYTLSLNLQPENAGEYGLRNDTIFYEVLGMAGQKIPAPAQVGSMHILTSERGNTAKISDNIRQNNNQYELLPDTTILGRNIKNAYVTPKNGQHTLFIFYTKLNGFEAFTTAGGEQWVRE